MRPAGVSVSRPIVSSDGRFSVSGWRARTFLSGHRAPRFDEMATAALRIGEALRGEGNLRHEGSISQPASGDKTLPKAP